MFDTRKKATMPQVLVDIKSYLTKRFLSAPVIDDKNLPVICQTLLRRYSSVKPEPRLRWQMLIFC